MAKDHGVDLVFTIELRDLGTYGFLLPETQVSALFVSTPSCCSTISYIRSLTSDNKSNFYSYLYTGKDFLFN